MAGKDVFEHVELSPPLSFIRGTVVLFSVFTSENPFWIKSVRQAGAGSDVEGIYHNGITDGTLFWDTGNVEPGTYYYVSEHDNRISSTIELLSNEGVSGITIGGGNDPPGFMFSVREANDDGDTDNPIDRFMVRRIGGRTASQIRSMMEEYRKNNVGIDYKYADDNVIDDILAHYMLFIDSIIESDLQTTVEKALIRSGFNDSLYEIGSVKDRIDLLIESNFVTIEDITNRVHNLWRPQDLLVGGVALVVLVLNVISLVW